jgi:hypothetical protein
LGYILGDFFTNSSGHTVAEEPANFFSEQNWKCFFLVSLLWPNRDARWYSFRPKKEQFG